MILGKIEDSYLLSKFKKLTLWNALRGFVYFLFALHFLLLLSTSINLGGWTVKSVQNKIEGSELPRGSLVFDRTEETYMPEDVIAYYSGDVKNVTFGEVNAITLTEKELEYQVKDGGKPVTIEENQVTGRVIWHIPLLGYLVTFDRTTTGLVVFALVFGLFLFGDFSGKLKREVEAFQRRVKENKNSTQK